MKSTVKSTRASGRSRKAPAASSSADSQSVVVFCDIGDVLGTAVFSPPPSALKALDVFPFVRAALSELRRRNCRLGIISNTGSETARDIESVLKAANLLEFFERDLLIYSSVVGHSKDSPEMFRLAAERAGLKTAHDRCLFVGNDPFERGVAVQAGFRVARDLSRVAAVFEVAGPAIPDVTNLAVCVEDARRAGLKSDPGPDDPTELASLLRRLEQSRTRLPPAYRRAVFEPFVDALHRLGPTGFNHVLLDDPTRERAGGLMMDIAHAILQNGEGFEEVATDAFEEVVTDLYDGFLSAHDRRGIKPPDRVVLAPLVKWGAPAFGPYTWPVDAAAAFNVDAAIVSLPPAHARQGLMAWAALAHEAAGHDILHADLGLRAELARIVQDRLQAAHIGFGLSDYWSTRIDETASDVMGILNMGPSAAIGMIGFFRGMNAAVGVGPRLRPTGPVDDPHPADLLRGFLASAATRLLSFDGADEWGNTIEREADRDNAPIVLANTPVSNEVAKKSAQIVATAIATEKTRALANHSLIEIQDWRNRDEVIVQDLRRVLTTTAGPSVEHSNGIYAAHVVAAAVMTAVAANANLPVLFARMIAVLKAMHDKNPAWGPLFITHPGTITRHTARAIPLPRSA